MSGDRYWQGRLLREASRDGEVYVIGGQRFVLRDEILRQVDTYSRIQSQTRDAFGFKWRERDTYESEAVQEFSRDWLRQRYLENNPGRLSEYFPAGAAVLDAGCGSGHSAILLLGEVLDQIHYLGVDISEAVDVARQRFEERGLRGEFLQADFTRLPFEGPTFDTILAEGTLHHTDSTRTAIASLSRGLKPGGHFLFYVYRKKGPIREFADDAIREHLQPMTDREAWDALMPLTRLGKALGDLNVTLEVPEAIPYLGIPGGRIDLQRFFYWHVLKAYYRPEMSLEEMNHINFDWYRPLNAYRQTPEEVRVWCAENRLAVLHMDIQDAGITVVACRSN